MSLRVLEPGLQTLVVDFGRPHCRSLGLPVGGAADRTSLMLGNALVGNAPDAAALEFSLHGPTLEAQCELACVVYGPPFELKCIGQKLRVGRTFTLPAGERLEIGGTHEGMRAYLCVAGGLQEKVILGSRSGLAPVQQDTVLQCSEGRIAPRFSRIDWDWWRTKAQMSEFPGKPMLRFLDGLQADWFPRGQGLMGQADTEWMVPPLFVVSQSSNRMGLRLQGPALPVPDRELVSEPVCPGSVQVTRDGQCIVLGIDGQTIGGYPKIAQVISADLDQLGQLRPGDQVFFQRVTLEEAERLHQAKQQELNHWITRMQVSLGGIVIKY